MKLLLNLKRKRPFNHAFRTPYFSTAATLSEHTVAWVFGQPVTDVPQDLFIPPDALKVVLSSFQGPLDLLLYLIRKAKYRCPRYSDGEDYRAVSALYCPNGSVSV